MNKKSKNWKVGSGRKGKKHRRKLINTKRNLTQKFVVNSQRKIKKWMI